MNIIYILIVQNKIKYIDHNINLVSVYLLDKID